jgi:esterase/lipase superfamily enzyme
MPTTVYFATNRVVTNSADAGGGYKNSMVAPTRPQDITYGTAFVDGVDVAAGAQGTVSQIVDVGTGGFSEQAKGDLSSPGRNLLVFVHGFDNSFSDAVTRAAFNREWLAGAADAAADMSVVAFSWPSLGELVGLPIPQAAYLTDQHMARNSGLHLMAFLANLQPILTAARGTGRRSLLLAHSMGHLALQSGVENWFLNGNGDAQMFDTAILAAGDCGYDAFDHPSLAGLSGLSRLAGRIAILYSGVDQVLQLSMVVNLGAKRLGQDGPHNRADTAAFPQNVYQMIDCSGLRDYAISFQASHQYYRLSPAARSSIAAAI